VLTFKFKDIIFAHYIITTMNDQYNVMVYLNATPADSTKTP